MKSFFLYIHEATDGVLDKWKVGKTMTPYSAVRSRSRNAWGSFGLSHLYFGNPEHISFLEKALKIEIAHLSGKVINGTSGQTELFDINIDELLAKIESIIKDKELDVIKVALDGKYTASNSGECPFGIPTETDSHQFLATRVNTAFGTTLKPAPKAMPGKMSADRYFNAHFTYGEDDMTEKATKLEFAPGCFDNFDGTQEELDALKAEIQAMFDSGEMEAHAVELDMSELMDEDPEAAEAIFRSLDSDSNPRTLH